MKVAIGALVINQDELKEALNIPEELEIISIEEGKFGDSFEFRVVSSDELFVDGLQITSKEFKNNNNAIRKVSIADLLKEND